MKKSKTMEEMPAFMSTRDLIELGIFSSIGAAFESRKHKRGPDYIKMQHKILYKKQVVIEWMDKRTIEGSLRSIECQKRQYYLRNEGYIKDQCTKEERRYLKDQCTVEEREEIVRLIGERSE